MTFNDGLASSLDILKRWLFSQTYVYNCSYNGNDIPFYLGFASLILSKMVYFDIFCLSLCIRQ